MLSRATVDLNPFCSSHSSASTGITCSLHSSSLNQGGFITPGATLCGLLTLRNSEESKSKVVLNDLPEDPIYTLAMDIPPSWLVLPREASYDLDNILTGLSPSERALGVRAVFDLDYLVIEGHAREERTMSPPRGLQLQLVSGAGEAIADTLVVANLGYLQFRAKPGVFRLEIRPGRGREIFALESVGSEGWESLNIEEAGDEVTLMSFEGLTLYPRMARLPGMDLVDVLADDAPEDESLVGKLKSRCAQLVFAVGCSRS